MKVGDLVRYRHHGHRRIEVGLVIGIESNRAKAGRVPYRVRWVDHCISERDWYSEEELIKL